ncbi:MAG: DMT family transporter [Bacteroidota bacterium]
MRLRADLILLLVSIIWGSAFAAQRVAGQLGSVYFFNGSRYLLAGLIVLPFALGKREGVPRGSPGRVQWLWMAAAGSVLFGAAAFQQAGMLYTTAANAGFITSLYVVFVPIGLLLFWGERPHWLAVVAVAMAVAGAFLLSSGGDSLKLQPGDALELMGAILWTFHVILVGKFAAKFHPISFSAGQLFVCGALNFIPGLFAERPTPAQMELLALPVAYTAVLALGLGYTLQVWAQRHTPPADAALILGLESVFAALAGWAILKETLSPVQFLGCALIFAAVVTSQAKPRVSV